MPSSVARLFERGQSDFANSNPIDFALNVVNESITPRGDVNWYQFVVDRQGELKVSITNVAAELDRAYPVWNANGDTLSDWFTPLAKGDDTTGIFDLPAPAK